jgi:hypothetical protein
MQLFYRYMQLCYIDTCSPSAGTCSLSADFQNDITSAPINSSNITVHALGVMVHLGYIHALHSQPGASQAGFEACWALS